MGKTKMSSPLFVGVDLAWSRRNPSGVVALAYMDDQLEPTFFVWERDLNAFFEYVKNWPDGLLVAIDAPLIVPNITSRREADAMISERFRKEEAGCLPANRTLLKGLDGPTWPESVVKILEDIGIRHNPDIQKGDRGKKVFEVFPHPAHVVLFGLKKTLKYKLRKGRTRQFREQELGKYLFYLGGLREKEPSLHISEEFLEDLKKGPLKREEDLLDALFCAYLSAWFYHHGKRGYEMVGDLKTGYILIPRKIPSFDEDT